MIHDAETLKCVERVQPRTPYSCDLRAFLTWTIPECLEGVAALELVVLLGCALLPHLTGLRQSGKV